MTVLFPFLGIRAHKFESIILIYVYSSIDMVIHIISCVLYAFVDSKWNCEYNMYKILTITRS